MNKKTDDKIFARLYCNKANKDKFTVYAAIRKMQSNEYVEYLLSLDPIKIEIETEPTKDE